MKNKLFIPFLLTIFFLVHEVALAQVSTTASEHKNSINVLTPASSVSGATTAEQQAMAAEGNLNQVLLDNATKSQDILNKQKANEPQSQNRINDLSNTNKNGKKNVDTTSLNLTDQEKQLSDNFVHQGKANRIIQEKCSGDMQAVCNGQAGEHKFMGMDPAFVTMAARSYAMFSAVGGDNLLGLKKGEKKEEAPAGGSTGNGGNNNGTPASSGNASSATGGTGNNGTSSTSGNSTGGNGNNGNSNKEDDKATDYCQYIPAMTEGVATMTQMSTTKDMQIQSGNGETSQKDSLLKAAKSHDSRAKMAQIQATGWFGGAACYGVSAATGKFAMDKNLMIKTAAATFLGAFYQSEVAANKEYAEKTRSIANLLPGKGDCNPVTDKLCYCSEPSTQNDPTYCMTTLHKKNIATTSFRVTCTDDKLKTDPTCQCEKTNSCFDTFLENKGEGTLQLGLGFATSPFSAVRSLSRGELVGGNINGSQSFDKTSAIARRSLNEMASKIPLNNSPINPANKSLVDAMIKKGIPANIARLVAENPPSQRAVDSAMAKVSGNLSGVEVASYGAKGSNIVDFSGGNGLGTAGAKAGKKDDDLLDKLKVGSAKGGNSNAKILEFAEKAQKRAEQTGQIRQMDDRPLFEIISYRYQISGRKRLEVDTNN